MLAKRNQDQNVNFFLRLLYAFRLANILPRGRHDDRETPSSKTGTTPLSGRVIRAPSVAPIAGRPVPRRETAAHRAGTASRLSALGSFFWAPRAQAGSQ